MPGILDRAHRRRTAGLLVLVAFEAMAVGTAMPTAVAEPDGPAWYGWPIGAFLVASVVGMVVGGDAGDRRGPRVALPRGVAAFAAGLAGLAGVLGGVVTRGLLGLPAAVTASIASCTVLALPGARPAGRAAAAPREAVPGAGTTLAAS